MNLSVDKAAKGLIKNGEVNEQAKNMIEMAFRAYDPLFRLCYSYFKRQTAFNYQGL